MNPPRVVDEHLAPVLAAIHAAAFPRGERWGPDAIALQLGLPGVLGFLDDAGGFILVRVVADEAEILTLAVAPQIARRGTGRRLVEAAKAACAARGALVLFLEVSAMNGPAQALYRACGFVQTGVRPRYYAGVDALVMRAAIACGSTPG